MKESDTKTIVSALQILANDIVSDDGVANACLIEAAERLQSLSAEVERFRAEHRWIPVEERLPDEDQPVLCIDSMGVQMIASYGWGEWWHPEIQADITHWMPLLDLPGKEVQG